MEDDLADDLTLLRETAKEAAELALSFWGRAIVAENKPDGSAITEADWAVDDLLVDRLKHARPDYGWLSEESGEHIDRLDARRVWIVDPIDGTRAFIQGRDDWTIALALVEDGTPVLAMVTNPVRGEVFEAKRDAGAYLNGRRLFLRAPDRLEGARLAIPDIKFKPPKELRALPPLEYVRANSSIYRFALIASRRADLSIALRPKWEWDVAPGALLVSEAGGTVMTPAGFPLRFNSTHAKVEGVVAAAPNLHQMLSPYLRDGADNLSKTQT